MNTSIAVVNCSGNVGKTTVTRQLLAPRLPGHEVKMMESINADEMGTAGVEVMLAREAGAIHERILEGVPLIVDVGASNVEEYLQWLNASAGSQEDYGLFIVPVVPARKQMTDTTKTIDLLADLGVDPDRIRVVLNSYEQVLQETVSQTVAREFAPLFEHHSRNPLFTLDPKVAIPHSDVFSLSAQIGRTIHEICHDSTDYRAMLASEPPGERRNQLVRLIGLKRLAAGMNPRLDDVFVQLTRGLS